MAGEVQGQQREGEKGAAPESRGAAKSTESAKRVSQVIRDFYKKVQEAAQEGRPIAWCKVGFPQEPLVAMGIVGVFPENYSTVCAAKRVNLPFMERAEGDGYANYLCSYARTTMGYASKMSEIGRIPEEAPWGGLPKPRMFLGATVCEPGLKWFHDLNRYEPAPAFVFDTSRPPADVDNQDPEIKKRYLAHEKGQLRAFIEFLEHCTGEKMNWDRLREAVRRHHLARHYWHETHALRRAIPSPMPSIDMVSCIFPGYFMNGTQEAVDFYQSLYEEVKARVEQKVGVIPNEKYRLLWVGIAQWHNLAFYNSLDSLGGVFVEESNYYRDNFIKVDYDDPLEAIAQRNYAEAALHNSRCRGEGGATYPRLAGMAIYLTGQYQVDGVVLHLNASCRPQLIGLNYAKAVLMERLNVPALLMESDICDPRLFSEAQTKEAVNAFIETVAHAKEARQRG